MSNCYFSANNLELEYKDKLYRVEVNARGTYTYDPGRMYMPNGDPGYPPEGDFSVDYMGADWYLINDDDTETEVKETRDMHSELRGYLEDHADWFEMEEPGYDW